MMKKARWAFSGDVNMSEYGGKFIRIDGDDVTVIEVVGKDTVEEGGFGKGVLNLVIVSGGELNMKLMPKCAEQYGKADWETFDDAFKRQLLAEFMTFHGGLDVLAENALKRGDGGVHRTVSRYKRQYSN